MNFFKKKLNNLPGLKKSRVARELPRPYVCKNVIVNKKKTRKVCKVNSFYTRMAAWLLGLVLLGATIYIFLFSQLLLVTAVEIRGVDNIATKDLLETVAVEMEGKMGGVFRRDNLLLVDAPKMETKLLGEYKRIKQVRVTRQFPDKLVVTLQERKSKLVYCIGGECLVVDEEGRAYAQADFENNKLGEKDLIVLRDDSGKKIVREDFFMEEDFIQFVLDVEQQLLLADIAIKKDFSTPILISGDVRVETAAGWKIYFSKSLGVKTGMEMLKTVLKNSIPEGQVQDLEYIDVRLADKVYYKLRTKQIENTEGDISITEEESVTKPVIEADKKKKK